MSPRLEILDDLHVLANHPLALDRINLDSVPLGSLARTYIPRRKISEVSFSPNVYSSRSGTHLEPEYFDVNGESLELDQVIDSVIDADGIVHFQSEISFKIAGGIVVRFSIYGDHLRCFRGLRSMEKCLALFGEPDRKTQKEAYGDLMGYDLFYDDSQMQLQWNSFAERIAAIVIGGSGGGDDATDNRVGRGF